MGARRTPNELGVENHGLLALASAALEAVFREAARGVRVDTGQALFRQGDSGDTLYIVRSGHLEVSVVSEDGRKLTLNSVGPGQIIGEIAIFDGGPRTATVEAEEPSELMEVSRPDIQRAIRTDASIAFELLELAGRRLRWLEALLEDRNFKPLEVRLAKRVLYLLENNDDVDTGVVSISQADLADHVGATRVAVATVLKSWRQKGVLTSSRGQIDIEDREMLAEIAEDEIF